jgi:predicted HicB family RNase H-like nuclease
MAYKFVLRLPDRLGEDLQQEAQKQGISLNQYLLYVLARYGVPKKTDTPAEK